MGYFIRQLVLFPSRVAGRLHRDERGTVSILTVFGVFVFTVLLVKVVNVGRQIDDKIRRQHTADAAAYSGGVVIARGMNLLAYTNHMEAEVFALTAYMRTAQLQNKDGKHAIETLVLQGLIKWEEIALIFKQHGQQAAFEKLEKLGEAIEQKVPHERAIVRAFTQMSILHSEATLPTLEYILHNGEGVDATQSGHGFTGGSGPDEGGVIPRFQRILVRKIPQIADIAANEVANRQGQNGRRLRGGARLFAHIWRVDQNGDIHPLSDGDEEDPMTRTIPAIDPSPMGDDYPLLPSDEISDYYDWAKNWRRARANEYLGYWIRNWQERYFGYGPQRLSGIETAKMSQYINFWRIFARGHLDQLLRVEYPETNLPHLFRNPVGWSAYALSQEPPLSPLWGRARAGQADRWEGANQALERDHRFVVVTYTKHAWNLYPKLFRNDYGAVADAQTFAQVAVLTPHPRLIRGPSFHDDRRRVYEREDGTRYDTLRGRGRPTETFIGYNHPPDYDDGWPHGWHLLHQNWSAKLVPATSDRLIEILQEVPPRDNNFRVPVLNGISPEELRKINKH